MPDYILLDGDTVIFTPSFGAATVVVQTGTLSGSGPAKVDEKNICVEGDEDQVSVPGCAYISGAYSVPGTGTLSISSLSNDQVAQETKTGDKYVLLKGNTFTAKFAVQSPAQTTSSPPTPDSMTEYSGNGSFITTNMDVKGT